MSSPHCLYVPGVVGAGSFFPRADSSGVTITSRTRIDNIRPRNLISSPFVLEAGNYKGRRHFRLQPLVRVFVAHAVKDGHEENLEVEHERPVLDVVQIVLDADAYRRVPTPAVH